MIFEKVSKAGKNLSSMTTPITVLAEENEVDVRKAAIHGFEVKEQSSISAKTCRS